MDMRYKKKKWQIVSAALAAMMAMQLCIPSATFAAVSTKKLKLITGFTELPEEVAHIQIPADAGENFEDYLNFPETIEASVVEYKNVNHQKNNADRDKGAEDEKAAADDRDKKEDSEIATGSNAKKENLRRFLASLSEKTNEYFKLLNENDFRGEIRIRQTANDSAEIRLFSSNGTYIKDPGGAQETTMYMSLLFAISDLTTLKKEEDYPLIFDAPTSSFEDFKENVFYNIIDKIDKQCIIVTKDLLEVDKKTGHKTLNTEKIESMTCSVYRIEKKAGYDQEDLSTIRTIITPIK